MPSLREFLQAAQGRYGAMVGATASPTIGPKGSVTFRYLRRETRLAILPDISDDAVLTPDVLRSLCVQLNIPPQDFGLSIG